MAEISVVIPVYIAANQKEEDKKELLGYMERAIDSMMNQTFKDFEILLVCEYGTCSESLELAERYMEKDSRIRVIENEKRLGISASLNVGIRAASGKYIARMDCDDLSGERRLEIQKMFMDYYKDVGICGVKHKVDGNSSWWVDLQTNHLQIDCELIFFTALRHPTIMIRTDFIRSNNLFYDESLLGVEDYDLFIRAAKMGRLLNIDEPGLFTYSRTGLNASANRDRDNAIHIKLMNRNLQDRLGLGLDDEQLETLFFYTTFLKCESDKYCKRLNLLEELLDEIVERNKQLHQYDVKCMVKTMQHRWFNAWQYMTYASKKVPKDAIDVWKKGHYRDMWME